MKRYAFFLLVTLCGCSGDNTLFTLLDPGKTGIEFNNFIEEGPDGNVLQYGYFYNGGGVAAADFNNDGLVDLYFTGNMVANKMYLNKGDLHFEDVSEKSGTGLNEGWKTGVSLVDINDDGWVDIFVCRAGAENPALRSKLLYVNNGKTADGIPTFTERSAEYGLDDKSYTTQAAFFDYDRDGDVDCFLLNHSVQRYAGFSNLISAYREQRNETYGNKLLRNDDGHFTNVTDSAGIVSNVLSFGLGINVHDFNNDGWQDIYISNDYNENDYLYLNEQNGRFREVIREATGHVSMYSMGTDAADLNNDGLADILTLDMLPSSNERIKLTSADDNFDKYQQLIRAGFHHQSMRNMLQLNNGVNENGVPVFSEIGQLAGVSNSDWSWAALMGDFDNDGWKDIFVSNGYARDYTNMEFLKYSADMQVAANRGAGQPSQMEIISKMEPINEPDYIYRNNRDLTFSKKVKEWGLSQNNQSNGAVYADLDSDGDLDLVVNNVNQKAFVYRNNSDKKPGNAFIKVRLQAPRYAYSVGARLTLYSDTLTQTQTFQPVRGFQSAQWDLVHFGMGHDQKIDSLVVDWADGSKQMLVNVPLGKMLNVDYNKAVKSGVNADKTFQAMWQAANVPDHRHVEDYRNDFRVQTLLPNMLSVQGPHVAAGDVNKDGVEDMYVAGGRAQAGSLFLSGSGTFKKSVQPVFEQDAPFEDSDAAFFDADDDGDLDLIVGSQGYELNARDSLLFPRFYRNQEGRFSRAALPAVAPNAGAVAVGDFDRDGDTDIFIGSRVSPGRFPESPGGVLLINDGHGIFTDQTSARAPALRKVGMVTDAVFVDLNKNGTPELVLTTDWGGIKVFENGGGKLNDATDRSELTYLAGCWNVLKPADLDGDGDMDFVVGNMGSNWQWNVTSTGGLTMYAGDFDQLDRIVPVIAITENEKEYPYASRDELLDQVPSLKKKYNNYIKYSKATLADLLPADKLGAAQKFKVKEFRSGLLVNNNGKFEFNALPVEAQFAPVFSIALTDMNGDGRPDLVLGGNLSQTRVRIGKNDASLVQLFMNDGKGRFSYVPQYKSGFYVHGDVRDLTVFTNGGETFVWVARNNAPMLSYKLLHGGAN